MHFHDRGKLVQVIRTSLDADSKKRKDEILGRLVKSNLRITPNLEAKLTAKERKEVVAWIEGFGDVERLKKDLAVRTLPEQLALAEEWFKDKKGDDARNFAATLLRGWAQLRTVIKRNGLVE
jgi:hypothetical protein